MAYNLSWDYFYEENPHMGIKSSNVWEIFKIEFPDQYQLWSTYGQNLCYDERLLLGIFRGSIGFYQLLEKSEEFTTDALQRMI